MGNIVKHTLMVLSAALALSLFPLVAYAAADPTIAVGPDETYKDLATALEAIPENAGDVVITVYHAIDQSSTTDFALEIPSDRGISSIRIEAGSPDGAAIGYAHGSSCLFANGIPMSIGNEITLNATLYGGSNEHDLIADTSLVVEDGATVADLRGGCLNGTLDGSTSLLVNGTVRNVVAGGGAAKAPYSQPASKTADVTGSCFVTIGRTGSVKSVYGGGEAIARKTGGGDTMYRANVGGSTTIAIDGKNDVAHGGGSASIDSTDSDHVLNAQAVANVGGDTSIVYGPSARTKESSSMALMQVYGGGKAEGSLYPETDSASGLPATVNAAIANVGGSTSVEAMLDDTAATEQGDNKAFDRFAGGGEALYPNAQANVEGGTRVKTARPAWESNQGIIGGGSAIRGATANVGGTTHVEVSEIEGQRDSYENANLVIGGGFAENFLIEEPFASAPTIATAGATEIVGRSGASLTSGSNTMLNVIGGGLARGNYCDVSVARSAATAIEPFVYLPEHEGVVGGGMVWSGSLGSAHSSAHVGSVTLTIGNDGVDETVAAIGNIVGGGFVKGYSATPVTYGAADVAGSVNLMLGSGVWVDDFIVGGGKVLNASDSRADVGDGQSADAIATRAPNGLHASTFYGGGCVAGSTNSQADVSGNVTTTLAHGSVSPFNGGSGVISNSTDSHANIDGNIVSTLAGFSFDQVAQDYLVNVVGNGAVLGGSASQANTTGDVTTRLIDCTINGDGSHSYNMPYLGGRSNSDVAGNAKLILEGTELVDQPIFGSKSYSGAIGGVAELQIIGDAVLDNWAYPYRKDNGTFNVTIGDDAGTATNVSAPGLIGYNDNAETNLSVLPNATLMLTNSSSTDPYHLQKIHNVDVAEGAKLAVTRSTAPASLTGNLTGSGTVSLPAGGSLAGSGTLDGNLMLEVTGAAADGQTYLDFLDASAGTVAYVDPYEQVYLSTGNSAAGRTQWTTRAGIDVIVVAPENGTINPSDTVRYLGEPLSFTVTPAYGYGFDSLLVNDNPVADYDATTDPRKVTYELTPTAATTVAATFKNLDASGMESVIDKLPDTSDPEDLSPDDKRAILDVKADFETAKETGAASDVSAEAIGKWNEALASLPEVEIEVSAPQLPGAAPAMNVDAADAPQLAGALDADDIESLEQGLAGAGTKLLKVIVTAESIEKPSSIGEQAAIEQALKDVKTSVAQHYNVSVVKQHFDDPDAQTPATTKTITQLPRSIMLQFAVPASFAPSDGTARTFSILRAHQSDGAWKAELLADENPQDASSVTVLTDQFSTYSLVYADVHTVTFVAGGGDADPADQHVDNGATATEPIEPTKEGYDFAGWYTDTAYASAWDFDSPVTKPLTLYAKWTPKQYEVAFVAGGGTPAPIAQTVALGNTVAKPTDPTLAGYRFDGWYTSDTYAKEWMFDTDTVQSAMTLYAKWIEDVPPAPDQHLVAFKAEGGVPEPAPQTVDDGDAATEPAKQPTREGYRFDGWFVDGDTAPWDFATPITAPLTLHAKWTIEQYDVTFETYGGSPAPAAQKVAYGTTVQPVETPARDGFEFVGWYIDSNLTRSWNFDTDTVKAPLTLYAKWRELEKPAPVKHAASFDTAGGSSVAPQTVEHGGKLAKPLDPTRAGYDFAGWFADTALTMPWDFDSPVTSDLTLFAKWAEVEKEDPKPEEPKPEEQQKPGAKPLPNLPDASQPQTAKNLAPTGDRPIIPIVLAIGALAAGTLALKARRARQ